MDLGIHSKKCLVTGGCSGIGASITLSLLQEGCEVTATSRKYPSEFIDRIPVTFRPKFKHLIAELSTADHILKAQNGKDPQFDILVNNAGHTLDINNPTCSYSDWVKVLNLNFLSCVSLVNYVLPYMKKNNWGRIVNITSCAGLENSGPVTFTTAKAALTAYTRSMGIVLLNNFQHV